MSRLHLCDLVAVLALELPRADIIEVGSACYATEMMAFMHLGHTITDAEYIKTEHEAVPVDMTVALEKLGGSLIIDADGRSRIAIPHTPVYEAIFTEREFSMVEVVTAMSAAHIRTIIQTRRAWQDAKLYDAISPRLVAGV
jgi:hypothetical protein